MHVRNSFKGQKEEQMADKYNDKTKKYDEQHSKRLASIERKIKAAYKKAAEDASKLATAPHLSSKKTYKLDDYPQAKKQADKILEELQQSVETIIVNGIESEWTLANNKNNELSQLVFGDNVGKLPEEQYQRYFSNNHEALQAFIARKQAGLNLSDRVWKYTGAFKDEIETAIDLGIRSGKSAAEISRDVRSYLQNPDKLFRRVKDEYGKLHLSKAAKAYHPGTGVYRSSYMNARRLAVTETNIAYRTADYIRQQQLDFIVGIRIVLSNNHNCKGVPAGMFFDICDSLQGNYPKDFKFTGWHPHCRCHVETILKTPEELEKDTERILAGRQTTNTSKNKIKDVPKAFKEWVKDNEDRILAAGDKLPYFLRDNQQTYQRILGIQPEIPIAPTATTLEKAAIRHAARTPEQQKAIIDAWNKRKEQYAAIEKEGKQMDALFKDISDVDTKALEKALKKYDLKTVKTEAAKLKKIKDELESCEWIENPMEMAKSFSAKAVRETEKDFVFRMDLWQKKYKYGKFTDAPLEHQKAKLQWELTDEIAAGKYKHPDLAMKALQKKLDDVQDKLEFEEFAAVQEEFKQFQKLHKSSVLDKQIKELDNAIKAHDKNSVKKAISELEETQKKLEATVKKAKPAPKVNLKSPNKNVSIQSNENTVNNFIAGGNKPYSRYSKEATDYVIANSNVVRNTFMEFAKTKEGLVFEKAELEALAKATSKEMLDAEVRKLRNKYWRNTSEVRKVSELVDEVYKECEMQARSVNNFTYQWDYEIRQFQRGKAVKSYHGHTKAEIKERAESVERFIACAPKWKGGDTFRGMSLSNEELEALIKDMKDGQGDMLGTASWSSLQKVSQGFASRHLGEFDVNGNEKTVRVLLKAKSHKRATPIMHLSEFSHEAEILSSQYERWKFVKMTKKIINGDEFTIIEVEPV